MVVLEEQLHDRSQVAAGQEGLAQNGVRAEIESRTQFQPQRRVAGDAGGIFDQRGEIVFTDAGSDASDSGCRKPGPGQHGLPPVTEALDEVDQDQGVLGRGAGVGHA